MTAPELVLGPLLRHTTTTTATVWVETSAPARVEVAGAAADTVAVGGGHYALVVVEGLEPGGDEPYEVRLDGRRVWPAPDDPRPAPRLRTLPDSGPLTVAFGSCRVPQPDVPPWTGEPGTHPDAVGVDALAALSLALQAGEVAVPDLLLLLGDQVYVDARLPPELLARQQARRGDSAPQGQVADLQELTWLYRDTWSRPEVRWLLATVPTAMVWDDHEVADGFASSAAWWREHRVEPWWPERVRGAYAAYWLYQHLGNLPPAQAREALEEVRADGGTALLRLADAPPRSWGHRRDLGPARLVVDDRGGRVLAEQDRRVLGEPDWAAAEADLTGDTQHLLVAAGLPVLLQPAVHDLERAADAVLRGARGRWAAARAERLRHGYGLDHWAAFGADWARLVGRLVQVAAGRHGSPPSTVLLLSGDVHYSYVARLRLPAGTRTRVVQVVSSPLRNGLPRLLQVGFRLAGTPLGRLAGRVLARAAGEPRRQHDWRLTTGPLYGNGLGVLHLDGQQARLVLHRAVLRDGQPALVVRHEERLDAP